MTVVAVDDTDDPAAESVVLDLRLCDLEFLLDPALCDLEFSDFELDLKTSAESLAWLGAAIGGGRCLQLGAH